MSSLINPNTAKTSTILRICRNAFLLPPKAFVFDSNGNEKCLPARSLKRQTNNIYPPTRNMIVISIQQSDAVFGKYADRISHFLF
jgi:hypothetical protein